MKHVFECGIVGESNGSPTGDAFLAKMVGSEKRAQLPDDFTVEINPHIFYNKGILGLEMFRHGLAELKEEMVGLGYRVIEYRNNDTMNDTIRFVKESVLEKNKCP